MVYDLANDWARHLNASQLLHFVLNVFREEAVAEILADQKWAADHARTGLFARAVRPKETRSVTAAGSDQQRRMDFCVETGSPMVKVVAMSAIDDPAPEDCGSVSV
jgi:hypothetical protein